jgi:hypothetical protein
MMGLSLRKSWRNLRALIEFSLVRSCYLFSDYTSLILQTERLLRVLTASDIVVEMGVTTYAANKITKAFTARTMNALVQAM